MNDEGDTNDEEDSIATRDSLLSLSCERQICAEQVVLDWLASPRAQALAV
jgi:hypothetical protein